MKKITSEQYIRLKNLSLKRFREIFHRRLPLRGYYNANRDSDEGVVKIIMWYYLHFKKKLWK